MKPGDEIEVLIGDLSSAGWGIGRSEPSDAGGPVVFVRGAAPGERVVARVNSVRRNRFLADLAQILTPSPHRVTPPCPHFGRCPGCSLQHISYEGQLEAKEARVAGILARALGRTDYSPVVIPSPEPLGYRTHLTVGCERDGSRFSVGLVDPETRKVVDIPDCLLIPDWANVEYGKLRELLVAAATELPPSFRLRLFFDFDTRRTYVVSPRGPLKRHRRLPGALGEILAVFPQPATLARTILGVNLRLHPASFVQANQFMIEPLYRSGLEAVHPLKDDIVCELYAGSGFFTLALAGRVREVVAIESDRRACDNLVKSARDLVGARRKGRSKEPAIHIAQGRAESIFREIVDEFAPTLVVANPPRSGLHAEVRSALGSSESIRRIVMISCDPSTCVRDMKELMSAGFVPEPAVLLDCYPQTPHMEIVLAMERP